jgi:hypothetical protein
VRVEAFGVRRSRLCGDVPGILEGSRPRQLTVQIAPSFGFGACDCRVRACIRFSRRHRPDDTERMALMRLPLQSFNAAQTLRCAFQLIVSPESLLENCELLHH